MANTRCIANKLEEQRRQAQNQELQDLHKALMWAFESSQDQCNKINCFCDQPTQHIDKLPDSHQLTLLTYDRIEHQGQVEDKSVHTVLYKPRHRVIGKLIKQTIKGRLTVIVSMKCTQQPEHIAEAVYLHHRKHLRSVLAVHYIGPAAAKLQEVKNPGRYEEHRLFALIYTSDEAFDTSFTINYPAKDITPNLPFTIVAGSKDTLREQGLETYDIRQIPDLLAVRPIYRPELNLTKQNMSSYCIFVNYQQNTPGWHTAAALEECLERHRKLTQTDHQVEMQLKPAYLWYDEQQTPCKFAMIQLQTNHGDQERQVRNVFNAAGLKYTINKQIVTVHGSLEGLEEVRLQLLQQGIKLPMTPTEGATQLTIHQTTPAKACQGFQGLQFYCKTGTIEYLSTIRLQIAAEHPLLCLHDKDDLCKQLQEQTGTRIEDLTLEQVSPDAGRSTQLVHTFLINKNSPFLLTPPYNCKLNIPTLGQIGIQLQHCGMRIGRQAPRKAIDKIQDTMADVHDSLIGQHQALPCKSGKRQRLGVTDTGTNESITRMQRVTIIDTYDGPSKTRALILREQMSIVAIDAQIHTDDAQDMYDKINLPKWYTRHPTTMQPKVFAHNMALDDYSKYLTTQHNADHEGCLLHLRIDGVHPFTLPKLNYDSRTGRCDATPSEAIELLPYQTFDIIMPLPSRMVYLMRDTKRIRVVGSVRLANNQGESPTKHNPKAQPTEQRTSHSQPHPSPPRPDTSSQSQLNTPPTPPALPAFPILQTRSNKPINHHPADQRPQQEGNTEYSPTLHFTIKEQPQAPEWERQQQDDITAHVPREPPEHFSAQAKGKQHTPHTAQTVQQISSEGEEDDDQEMAEQSDQDVEMESAHPDTGEIDDPEGKPASSTNNTNQQKRTPKHPKSTTTGGPASHQRYAARPRTEKTCHRA